MSFTWCSSLFFLGNHASYIFSCIYVLFNHISIVLCLHYNRILYFNSVQLCGSVYFVLCLFTLFFATDGNNSLLESSLFIYFCCSGPLSFHLGCGFSRDSYDTLCNFVVVYFLFSVCLLCSLLPSTDGNNSPLESSLFVYFCSLLMYNCGTV